MTSHVRPTMLDAQMPVFPVHELHEPHEPSPSDHVVFIWILILAPCSLRRCIRIPFSHAPATHHQNYPEMPKGDLFDYLVTATPR